MSGPHPEVVKESEAIEAEAMRLFRQVHGEGDSGSPMEYHALNPALQLGWLLLAGEFLRLKKSAAKNKVRPEFLAQALNERRRGLPARK